MHRLKPYAVLLLLLGGTCAMPHRPIPPGTYDPESGEERIVVVPTRIFFHVNVEWGPPDMIHDREYPYDVAPDDSIHFTVSSNDPIGLSLAGYQWLWRDGKIAKVDRETRETSWFNLRERVRGRHRRRGIHFSSYGRVHRKVAAGTAHNPIRRWSPAQR